MDDRTWPTFSGEPVAAGTLYVVATPIGNLEDLSFRALRVLAQVQAIAAEDTRHTAKLLNFFGLKTPQLSYHEHNQSQRIAALVARLQAGEAIALVSDAGVPGISDPGEPLIAACVAAGVSVVPIPGPCAAIAALSASGLASDRFVFEGFLAVKGTARRDRLLGLSGESRTVILYEAPHRLAETLADLAESLGGDRRLAVARELSKRYEQFWRGTVAGAIAAVAAGELPAKGELVLVVAGAVGRSAEPTDAEIQAALQGRLDRGESPSRASRQVAEAWGLSRRRVYDLSIALLQVDPPAQDGQDR